VRGRPPVTRARVLNYIEKHQPKTVIQIARALQMDRAQLYRVLHAAYGPDFRQRWPLSAETASSHNGLPLAA
jgi:hypothetical protein